MSELVLTSIDKNTAVCQQFKAHFEDRLAELRVSNDGLLPKKQTALIRGRIAELKRLLSVVAE